MAAEQVLKMKNEYGTFEIRMESIGGQGANLAGKMLAEAGIMEMGLNGVNFASYGSEKKGTPVKSFVRFAEGDDEIRLNSPVVEPHLLVVFSTILTKSVPIMSGVKPGSTIIVNTTHTPEEIRDMLEVPGGVTIITVDGLGISVEEKVRINTTILGTVARALDFFKKEAMEETIKKTFEKKYPKLVAPNLRAYERGFNEAKVYLVPDDGKYPVKPFQPFHPKLGWKNAPIGGIITNPGNTVLNDMEASRTGFIPVHIPEKCIHCAECDSTCPDQCIHFKRGTDDKGKERQFFDRINLMHCKGCLRCVEICPKQALVAERE